MRFPTVLCLLAFACLMQAQTDPKVFTPYSATQTSAGERVVQQVSSLDSGKVTIHESKEVTALMKSYATTKQPLKGYRVQIFLGERNKAEEIRRSFLIKHPEIPAYLSYLAPNFRVRVGDERTKMDGERLRMELLEEFNGLYVVPDEIELPRLKDEK
ncbi:MAG: hypothetical protein IPP33_16005 [Flavobacteriales bacterium]|nr:hypothetical protein [Flavobacteriales bacterium]